MSRRCANEQRLQKVDVHQSNPNAFVMSGAALLAVRCCILPPQLAARALYRDQNERVENAEMDGQKSSHCRLLTPRSPWQK
mmetsp:Transcript_23071/g.64505  ORF Transcript_23071/g.64505 Transcript_23071/m.64505 type:complete len:81 (-) Transcript_23071:93-335(-)